ncbi:MAG: nucleotide exchange factor GrpE [Elusimicrobia bacterium RIFOXYB2_FULL_49_7]|nr:MAG: nucleotide exchange factor GrpE [Elusimicrobia bacterium RIFOXYB2_FULL_49_7]
MTEKSDLTLQDIDWKNLYDILTERYEGLENTFLESRHGHQRSLKEERTKIKKQLIGRMCLIADNVAHLKTSVEAGHDLNRVAEGIRLIEREFLEFLKNEEVTLIVSQPRDKFNPFEHDAFDMEASSDIPEGYIVREIQKGYKIEGILLRPARVIVSSGAPKSA